MKAPIKDGIVYSPYPEVELDNGSFFEAIKTACLNDGGKPILIDDFVTLTKTEFVSLLRRYAAGLQKHGVQPGDRVCVHIGNSVDNFVAMWSCVVAGASITMAKPSLTERELRYQITDSDSTHLLVEPELSEKARRASSELGLKGLFTTRSTEGFISMAPFADMAESEFQEVAVDDPHESILAIVYTSGTTGLPKGVQITHYGFLANIGMSRCTCPWDEHDVIALPTPITHGSGLVFITISVLLGTTCVIIPPNLGLPDMAKVVEQHQVTAAILLPWHLRTIVSEMQSTGIRLRGLRRVCTGGMVLSPSQYKAVQEAFGEGLEVLANVYAMTEAASLLCSPSRDHAAGVDMGFPAPATMFKVVDKLTGRCLGPYKTGELLFKAPTVMKGYYKRPTETAEFFDEEGWCKSGDAGYYDEDGRIYFVQRFKEMIKCMDNQVTPAELEDLLLREHSSDIADVCIVGMPDTVYGEAPAAAVVTRCTQVPKDLSELSRRIKKTIIDNCAVHKHLYGGVFFVDCIPKTESGKTDRPAVLRKCF